VPKSLRLGAELEREIERYCTETGKTTSAVIRESVAEYLVRRRRKRPEPTAWELGKDLFGTDRSQGPPRDASARVKELVREKLRAKHHR
jgi:hypothetical protein